MGSVSTVGRKVDVDDLVTAGDIMARVPARTRTGNVQKPQVVHVWMSRYEDFPPPVRQIGGYQVWVWSDVEKWLRTHDRL